MHLSILFLSLLKVQNCCLTISLFSIRVVLRLLNLKCFIENKISCNFHFFLPKFPILILWNCSKREIEHVFNALSERFIKMSSCLYITVIYSVFAKFCSINSWLMISKTDKISKTKIDLLSNKICYIIHSNNFCNE